MPKIQNVLFMGSKRLGLRCLEQMCKVAPASLSGIMIYDDREDTRSIYDAFVSFCSNIEVPFYSVRKRKESEEVIRKVKPDLCIVVGWYWLISKETLNVVPYGFLGLHNSLLPKYRGAAPLVWAIINDEKETGISLFSFTEGMDDGDIWAQEKVSIKDDDYISDILNKIEDKGAYLFKTKYKDILEAKIEPKSQKHEEATYCAMRFPFDGEIDWNKPARYVYNYIRAQSEPYPGAFTYYNDKKLIIWKAKDSGITYYGKPGQVAMINEEGVFVVCGDNYPVIIKEVQLEHEQKVAANEVVKSFKTRF